jgi:DNA anti-recombination protein RmuC
MLGKARILVAKQSEIDNLRESMTKAESDNASLQSEIQTYREENATIKTSLELERKQFDEKLILLNESRDQLTVAFKNIANEIAYIVRRYNT